MILGILYKAIKYIPTSCSHLFFDLSHYCIKMKSSASISLFIILSLIALIIARAQVVSMIYPKTY